MPEIKISQMPELLPFDPYTFEGGTDAEDLLPIIDDSETNLSLKNKKVKISTLFENYTTDEDLEILINVKQRNLAVTRQDVLNNTLTIRNTSGSSIYWFLNPTANRNVIIDINSTGATKFIKNTSSVNTVTLTSMLTGNGLTPYTYVIQPEKTVHLVFDGVDHHIIPLD